MCITVKSLYFILATTESHWNISGKYRSDDSSDTITLEIRKAGACPTAKYLSLVETFAAHKLELHRFGRILRFCSIRDCSSSLWEMCMCAIDALEKMGKWEGTVNQCNAFHTLFYTAYCGKGLWFCLQDFDVLPSCNNKVIYKKMCFHPVLLTF